MARVGRCGFVRGEKRNKRVFDLYFRQRGLAFVEARSFGTRERGAVYLGLGAEKVVPLSDCRDPALWQTVVWLLQDCIRRVCRGE